MVRQQVGPRNVGRGLLWDQVTGRLWGCRWARATRGVHERHSTCQSIPVLLLLRRGEAGRWHPWQGSGCKWSICCYEGALISRRARRTFKPLVH